LLGSIGSCSCIWKLFGSFVEATCFVGLNVKFFSQAKVALFGNTVVAYLVVFPVVLEFRDVFC